MALCLQRWRSQVTFARKISWSAARGRTQTFAAPSSQHAHHNRPLYPAPVVGLPPSRLERGHGLGAVTRLFADHLQALPSARPSRATDWVPQFPDHRNRVVRRRRRAKRRPCSHATACLYLGRADPFCPPCRGRFVPIAVITPPFARAGTRCNFVPELSAERAEVS